jgi:pimeloyl-ACP methyl ester carboxylesterase
VDAPPRGFRNLSVSVVSHRDPLPRGWTTPQMAEDLAGFVADVIGRPAVIVGHSMGGMVAQHLAARWPDLVDRLVMSSTVPSADAVFSARLERWEQLLAEEDWRGFYRDAVATSFTGVGRLWRLAALRLSRAAAPDPGLVERHRILSAACRTHDATGVLDRIAAPTLVLAGREDELTRPERARELAEAVTAARLRLIDRAGHGLPDQRGRVYAQAIRRFLDRTPP